METLKKSIGAGVMIGIGATIYLACSNKIVGAILFSLGLFVICSFGLNLYTGKIGYVLENKNRPNCLLVWVGNLIGCILSALPIRIAKPQLHTAALKMMETKLSLNVFSIIILSMFCGILMYIAVHNFKVSSSDFGRHIGIIFCVAVFILCGFEHSIADICYAIFAINSIEMATKSLIFVLIVSLSNAIGAIGMHYLLKQKPSDKPDIGFKK